MSSVLMETHPYRCLSPSWVRRILHIVAVVANTPITVEDVLLTQRIWVYANKTFISIEDCWLILESILKDDRILGRLLRTATFITLLSIADEDPSQLDWRRVVDDAFSPEWRSNSWERKECYRQRLIVLCPMYIFRLWNEGRCDMDTVQRVFQLLDVLEREDFRLILKQLLVRISKSNGKVSWNTKFSIEPVDWVMKTKRWLSNVLQLQINQFSEEKRFSYRAVIAFWKLAIWSPQHTFYQICNSAVLREGDLTKYLSLVKELYPIASFESEVTSPCVLIQWLQQSLQIVVEEESGIDHPWIPSQVSAEALREWTSQLMEGGASALLDPLHYVYYVLVPLPVVEKWIPYKTFFKLDMISNLLEIAEKGLLQYYRNYNQMVEWGLHGEEKELEFRMSIENSVFEWLRNIDEKRWLLPFSVRRKFVNFLYTFLLLPRKERSSRNEYWNRWISQTNCYSTRVLLYCLYSRTCFAKLQIPCTFHNNDIQFDWNAMIYLYLREVITIGEVSLELGREAFLCVYESATKCLSTIEKELVLVEIPYQIAQFICDWESSEQLWRLILLQKWVYLSSSELERLACGLLTCAVECNTWKDSMKSWMQSIYKENPLLLSSREDVHASITIGQFFLRLLPYYYRVDHSVLLTCDNECVERKYAIQMVSGLIQTFQAKMNVQSISRLCYAFEILVEATEVYSSLFDEIMLEKDEDILELWDILLLGLSTELWHSEMGNIFMVPFLQHTPDLKNNKLKEQLQNKFN
ncbi:uncharacterized protein Gasu_05960 [Galdieria sulphuraria]|uniref:Uncharacterized protein n=1 Tax=Galdieria sulphuraria TaxID=130081 RepID=M2Y7X9_GALSU|nr:uncharacterized protein Gasu_05960 [Galdieria sulphuraria]EME32183.1 hypothetical protein Gasu_05960 [Galdieria sulphuraria]|eukprot:XP_005708703.1 hypothetical protein Gasu_05960 [Galdieria sulphuraria]